MIKMKFAEFVGLMALFVSITALSIDTVLPALSVIGHDMNIINTNHTQYIISVLFVGFTIGQIICGPISDSIGRKKGIYIGLMIFILGSVLSSLSLSFDIMLIGRFLQGFGAAFPRVTSVTIVRDYYHGREMSRVMSFVMAVFIFVPAIAPTVGEGILYLSGWRSIFIVFIIAATIAAIWAYFRLPETLKPEDKSAFEFRSIWERIVLVVSNKVTLGYAICAGIAFGGLIGYINSARQIFQDYFHTGSHFVIYFAMSALSIGLASVVNSMIVMRVGMRRICHYALLTIMLVSALFLVVVIMSPHHTMLWQFMIYATVLFFCFGLLFGNLNALAMEPMGHLAGTASAVIGSFSSAISVVIGTIIGQAYNNTLIPIIAAFFVISVLVFILQLRLAQTNEVEEVIPARVG